MTDTSVSLASRLRADETVVTAWSTLAFPMLAELLGRAGYRAVTLDMQHGAHDIASVRDGIAAARLGDAHAVVRPPVDDFATVSRLFDLGAEAVIMPMVNTPEDALALVAAAKYPPLGARSWGPHRAAMLQGVTPADYLERANRETIALAMIETPAALEALDEILAVDGLDGVFVGPGDMSLTLSDGAELNPSSERVQTIAADVAAKAKAAGKLAGIFTNSVEDAKRGKEMGFRFIALGIDMGLFADAASSMAGKLR
ncbi:HpcH/HpaI aldolase/citrate lyase family protein [Stappia sp. ES.058]|uniref:HpcH/HpaI aldolase family protein n=1 Tax=Stappia sp. ES.058 TaxID=1881061 RepID=UPI00087DC603|nr:aldolase/citrate lyase family protein [Stappia sp. ES.058]SDU22966.1 4-hydroxy-2-oxoheptanedioate aldolase [Stappia sp. ES.058]